MLAAGFALHNSPSWPVAAIRPLTLTGVRLSEVISLKWDENGGLGYDGASARLEDAKTGPRTVWLGPEAARLLAGLSRSDGSERVFPEDLTSARLYTFWVGIREEARLPGLRIHDACHIWASQSVMNGVGLKRVGRLLGHRRRRTTAIYAHLDDTALQDAAARAASVIARAMGCRAELPPMKAEALEEQGDTLDGTGDGSDSNRSSTGDRLTLAADPFAPPATVNRPSRPPDGADMQDKKTEESTPFASHHDIMPSRAKPEAAHTRISTRGQRPRICTTIRAGGDACA